MIFMNKLTYMIGVKNHNKKIIIAITPKYCVYVVYNDKNVEL